MSTGVHVAALGLTALGLLFCIISTSTKHWYESDSGNIESYIGLWESCYESAILSDCSSVNIPDGSNGDKFHTVRAFTIMAILAFAFAGLCLLITFVKRLFLWIFFLCIFGAAACQVIAMAIYTDLYTSDDALTKVGNFGWSFILGWVGFAFALISLGVGCIFKFTVED